jgi:hypothetical protein
MLKINYVPPELWDYIIILYQLQTLGWTGPFSITSETQRAETFIRNTWHSATLAEYIFLTMSDSIQAVIAVSSFMTISKYCTSPTPTSQHGSCIIRIRYRRKEYIKKIVFTFKFIRIKHVNCDTLFVPLCTNSLLMDTNKLSYKSKFHPITCHDGPGWE